MIDTVRWHPLQEDSPLPGMVRMIDQTKLPESLEYLETDDLEEIFGAIQRLSVRGAPAIGCAAAFGLAAVCQHNDSATVDEFVTQAEQVADRLAASRPTAVNLFWALNRCLQILRHRPDDASVQDLQYRLWREAQDILEEDINMCRKIGAHGLELLPDGSTVLTHCNAGALATGDYGTALSPIYTAHEAGHTVHVYADETRPLLQGARLTAWELQQAKVPVTVICDNMAAQLMAAGKIDLVIVGSDRIAANGDAANKIGTYGVAVLAHYHKIPFYVAAPYSTIDMSLRDGTEIPIEQRDPDEVANGFNRRTVPVGVDVHNPAFDVTPHELIHGIITDRDLIRPPYSHKFKQLFGKSG